MGLFGSGDRRRGRRRGLLVGAAAGAGVAKARSRRRNAAAQDDPTATDGEVPTRDSSTDGAPVDTREQLAQLQGLRDDKLISAADYEAKKKQILGI